MKAPLWLCLSLLLAPALAMAGGQAQVGGPRVMLSDAAGHLYPTGASAYAVAADGVEHRMYLNALTYTIGKQTIIEYDFIYQVGPQGTGTTRRMGHWSTAELFPTAWEPHAGRMGADGHFYALVSRIAGTEHDYRRSLVLMRDGEVVQMLCDSLGLPVAQAHLLFDGQNRPIVFFQSTMRYTLERVTGPHSTETIFGGADYDWSVARDTEGHVYVSAYDYENRALVVFAATEGVWQWRRLDADTRESGWQHSVAASGDAVFVLSYYLRNPFNRGLNVITLKGGDVAETHTYFRTQEKNGGWAPQLGIGADGHVEVTHRADEQGDVTIRDRFDTVADFVARRAEAVTGGWEDDYRSWSVTAALLPTYQQWRVFSPKPDRRVVGAGQIDATYDYDPAVEIGGSVEARLGDFHLGLIYLQNLVSQTIEDAAGKTAARSFQVLSGWIGVDQLLFGHDLKISSSFGNYRGTYSDNLTGRHLTKTPVTELEVRLLNQWRLGYGLSYRSYDLTLPFYLYRADAGVRDYDFVGSGVADARIKRFELFVGYSRIDYLTKYENDFNGIDFDVRLGLGPSVVSWDAVTINGKETSGTGDVAVSTALRLGYVLYHRFYALQGAGFFLRGGYEGAWLGSGGGNSQPDRRDVDEASEKSDITYAAHHQLLHGPYVQLGLVY